MRDGVHARPHEPDRLHLPESRPTPHEPTWPHAPTTPHDSAISWFAQSFLIKRHLFFSFSQSFLLHHCYNAHPFLLQCSIILVNSVIPCCYSVQPFFTGLQCSSTHSAKVLSHFPLSYSARHFYWTQSFLMLHCSVIFYWATELNRFPLLQCSTIYKWLQWTQLFLLQFSVILWFCQPFSRFCHAFCYSSWLFYDFVSHSWDPVSHFTTMLSNSAKLLSHSWVSIIL
jgi:hypothetical protein